MTGVAPALITLQQTGIHRFDQSLVVALNALNLRVPPGKRESGVGIVIELRLFFGKARNAVAGDTGRTQNRVIISLMGILVAGVAIRKIKSSQDSKAKSRAPRRRLMAFDALDLRMAAHQFESRIFVVVK